MTRLTRRGLLLTATTATVMAAQTKKTPKDPSLTVTLPSGSTVSTKQMLGNVCAIEIFKTTCPHCQKSLPLTQKAYMEFAPKGFKVVGVAVDQNPEPLVKEFAKTYKVGFPLGWAPIEDICAFLDIKPEQLYVPALVILDRSGKVRGKYLGGDPFFNMEEANLKNMIELLLKEPRKS